MSDARSLTPLSQADYEAIEAAVMETARGRWFMAEYARRNRQADTQQLLTAIHRIERVVGLGVAETTQESNLIEAAALIHDLRADLERISGRMEERSCGLSTRIEVAGGIILAAAETIQETAWTLRESGADEALCDKLDRRTTDISAAVETIDALSQRMDKIADTIAMLDSSLRAFGETAFTPKTTFFDIEDVRQPAPPTAGAVPMASAPEPEMPPQPQPGDAAPEPMDDVLSAEPQGEMRVATIELLEDDLVFAEIDDQGAREAPESASVPLGLATARSELALRDIDALPAERKLAYFA